MHIHELKDWPGYRDIQDLIAQRILVQNPGGGRSTSYSLAP